SRPKMESVDLDCSFPAWHGGVYSSVPRRLAPLPWLLAGDLTRHTRRRAPFGVVQWLRRNEIRWRSHASGPPCLVHFHSDSVCDDSKSEDFCGGQRPYRCCRYRLGVASVLRKSAGLLEPEFLRSSLCDRGNRCRSLPHGRCPPTATA